MTDNGITGFSRFRGATANLNWISYTGCAFSPSVCVSILTQVRYSVLNFVSDLCVLFASLFAVENSVGWLCGRDGRISRLLRNWMFV